MSDEYEIAVVEWTCHDHDFQADNVDEWVEHQDSVGPCLNHSTRWAPQ